MRPTLLVIVLAVICASCGNSSTSPTTTTGDSRSTSTFTGTIAPGEARFYSFTVTTTGTTDITLLSLHPSGAPTPALSTPMALSVGTPAGTGCRPSTTVVAQAALLPQLSTQTSPTIYCVNLNDTGGLASDAAFTIRITYP